MGVASVAALFFKPARMTLDRYPADLRVISVSVSTGGALAGRLGRRPAKPMGSPRVGLNAAGVVSLLFGLMAGCYLNAASQTSHYHHVSDLIWRFRMVFTLAMGVGVFRSNHPLWDSSAGPQASDYKSDAVFIRPRGPCHWEVSVRASQHQQAWCAARCVTDCAEWYNSAAGSCRLYSCGCPCPGHAAGTANSHPWDLNLRSLR
jgi:hypothetical protein